MVKTKGFANTTTVKKTKNKEEDNMKAVHIDHVNKKFEDRKGMLPNWLQPSTKAIYAVDDVAFHIDEREIFGVLGPNGCGKSTLIRMLSTLLVPDSGRITVFGHDVIAQPDAVKPLINRVSVEANFFKALSAKENLLYAARLFGLPEKKAMQRIKDLLKELDFPLDKMNEVMHKFSRGQQQKVAIARGFLSEPRLLLLDEPTTGLDPKSKLDVQKFIHRIRDELGVTILITSHDMEEIDRLCDRIAIMERGKIIALGTSDELKHIVQEKEIHEVTTSDNTSALALIEELSEVDEAYIENDKVRFLTDDFGAAMHRITHALHMAGVSMESVAQVKPSLEDVFIELTGHAIEEEQEENQ